MYKTYIHPSGPREATMAFVGEQPGINEIRAHPPKLFLGPTGKGLDECLLMTKISRREIYLTNVIKDLDAPLKEYINIGKYGKFTISENGYAYINELKNELSALPNLNVVVAFGNVALLALTNRIGITKWRGSVLDSTIIPGLKVVPTFHPATFIPPKFTFLNKPLICEDLLLADKESKFKEIIRTPRNIRIKLSFDESVSVLNYCLNVGKLGTVIPLDIEVINGELDCISFSWSPTEAISIPFKYNKGDYFNIEQELYLMRKIAEIIEAEDISKIGANFIFDLQFLFHKYGICPRGPIHCTQIAQKISFPDFPASLAFVTNMHTDVPYYKQEGKQWMKSQTGAWDTWWNYNGMDSIIPSEAHPKQIEILKKQGNIETYDYQRKLIKPLIYMSERGIKIDVAGMVEYKESQQTLLDDLVAQLIEGVGHDINYNSPQQLGNYFYKECKIKPYVNNKTGKQSTDVDALKRICRLNIKGSAVARIMLDLRSLGKRLSTYLNIGKIDRDSRYRSSFKPVGADTGRISSGETIFGTGGNQQNWPHDLLRFFLFDEGFVGYSFDLSQIENRIVAYVGGVIPQIEAFEKGIDLHSLTASIVLGKPYDQISSEDGSSDLGDGRQSERYWGKKSNHAINYDTGYKTFALKNEMSERDAKGIMSAIHQGYPQIRDGYHQLIQNMLKRDRTVTNLYGRTRLFLGPIYPSYPASPISACTDTYRAAYAHFSQSTCADKIIREGMEFIYYDQQQFKPIDLLSQVHDSIVFQIPKSLPFPEHAKMLLAIKRSLETSLDWRGTEIKTPADLAIGFNMDKNSMVEYKSKDIPNTIQGLSDLLSTTYSKLMSKE